MLMFDKNVKKYFSAAVILVICLGWLVWIEGLLQNVKLFVNLFSQFNHIKSIFVFRMSIGISF